jgi:hypothetical protein
MTEKQQFLSYVHEQKKQGLKKIYFTWGDTEGATEESLYGELNRMLAAKDVPDPEVLGNYSPL